MRRPPTFALVGLSLLLLPLLAQAQSPSFAAERETAWENESRHLQLQSQTSGFTYTSSRNSTLGSDVWRLSFDAATATLRYSVNATAPRPQDSQLHIVFRRLIEFQDLDGDGRFSLGDPVVQQLLFSEGGGWIETVQDRNGERTPVAHYWMRGARVDLTFQAVANGTTDAGATPTLVPAAVRIQSFPFQSDNLTHVALELRVLSPVSPAGSAVASPTPQTRSFLSWTGPRDATGNATPFGVSLHQYLGQPNPQWVVTLSEPRENVESFDLYLGVARLKPAETIPQIIREISGDWRFYVLGLMAAGLVIGWPLYQRLRLKEGA